MTLKEQLESVSACEEAIEWVGDRTLEQAWNECHRGDWMLWLFRKADNYDFQKLTLARGHCANTVRHLMKDDRSKKAVDVAINFGNGSASRDELAAAAYAAYAAAAYNAGYSAYAAVADAATYAAYAAATAADDAATATYATYAATYATYAADADARKKAREENRKLTADICRKYLPIPLFGF